jgi:FixJ family two-component response regulator
MANRTLKEDLFRFAIRRLVDRARAAVSKEVLVLVVRGLLNKQIASKLGISEATVKMHRGHVTAKDASRLTR